MQLGSLVVMSKPLADCDIEILLLEGFKKWPVPDSNIIYELIRFEPAPPQWPNKIVVGLDLYKDIDDIGIGFSATLFDEIQPPTSIDVEELVPEEMAY